MAGYIYRIGQDRSYTDLDELIVNYVKAIARKVEELMADEKYRHESPDQLSEYLSLVFCGLLLTPYYRAIARAVHQRFSRQEHVYVLFRSRAPWVLQAHVHCESQISCRPMGQYNSFTHYWSDLTRNHSPSR